MSDLKARSYIWICKFGSTRCLYVARGEDPSPGGNDFHDTAVVMADTASTVYIHDSVDHGSAMSILQNAKVRMRGTDRDPWVEYGRYSHHLTAVREMPWDAHGVFTLKAVNGVDGNPIKIGEAIRIQAYDGKWAVIDGERIRFTNDEGGADEFAIFEGVVDNREDWCIVTTFFGDGHPPQAKDPFRGTAEQCQDQINRNYPKDSIRSTTRKYPGKC